MADLPRKATLPTIIRGFDEAYARLSAALEQENDPQDVFVPLFETLSWADLLLILEDKGKIQIAVSSNELKALKWARGHAHHSWGNVLEIGDILWPQPLIAKNRAASGQHGPIVVLGWRWVEADDLNDITFAENRTAYGGLMGGKPAHEILARFRDGLRSHF